MKREQKVVVILLLFYLTTYHSIASTGYEFLKVPPSPVISSLADACSSFYNNASSFYCNPAILTFHFPYFTSFSPTFKSVDLYFSYIKYYQQMNYFSLFSVMDIKKIKRIGIGFTGLFYGDIELSSYNGENYTTQNKINMSSYSFLIGYGYNITDRIGIGINLKIPIEDLGNKTSIGIGTDIGGIYKYKDWDASVVIQDIGKDLKGIKESHNLPMRIKLGGNYRFYLLKKRYQKMHRIRVTGEIGKEVAGDFIGGIGIEYSFCDKAFLRNGYFIDEGGVNIRIGCGVKYKDYQMDYGYNWNNIGNIHRIGIGMRLNIGIEKEIEIETERTKEGTVLRISDKEVVLFEHNKATIKKDGYKVLDKIIEILERAKGKEILICGHTDNIGSDEYNLRLSERRAEAVYRYLARRGIKKERMSYKGYGESKPIASNKTEEGRARNRRVEIIILRLSKKERKDFNKYFYNGLDHYYREGYEYAIKEWEKALKIDPENEEVKKWIKKAKEKLKAKKKRK